MKKGVKEKKVFRWWWGWNPEKIENWLEEEEQAGWHLNRISGTGLWFWFERGEKRSRAYCIDYQTGAGADYRQLCEDAGWTLVNEALGWYYWAQTYSGDKPRIFSDTESLIGRNRRQMWLLGVLVMGNLGSLRGIMAVLSGKETHWGIRVGHGFQTLVILLLLGLFIRFLLANRQLRRRQN